MWHDYAVQYGVEEAKGICNRYLDMQVLSKDPEEIKFCRELFEAIPKTTAKQKPSILTDLSEKKNAVQDNPTENTAQKKREER